MSTVDLDPVGVLRRRLQSARNDLPPPSPGDSGGTVLELDEALTVLNAVCAKVTHPAVLAVARELVGTGEQRILDGEFGHEASLAMTRVVLDLAHARGEVQALERELRADRAPWQVVDTEPDTQVDISSTEIPAAGGEQS